MSGEWAFWRDWPRPIRNVFAAAGILVSLLIIFCLGAELVGHSLVLEWYLSTETESVTQAVEKVSVGLFEIDIPADILLVRQHFEGSPYIIRPWAGTLYLACIFFFYSILLTVSTYLSKFWYLVSAGIFIGLLVSMRLEQLLLFGWFDYKPLVLALILFLPLSYYFHAFRKRIPLVTRLLSFMGAFLVFSIVIYFGAGIDRPLYSLAQYNFAAPVLLTIAFAILVGHEVIYFILMMITRGKAPAGQKNWIHFFTFSLIYLINVGLVYARNAGFIDWDIIYLSEVLLLSIAGVLGLWGLKAREARYQATAAFYPKGALFYAAMAGISFTTIAYQLLQGNDPVLETFEDGIVFSQLGFGVMFLLYVIVNYINPLMANLPVYKIVFKEGTLPYTTYRLAGLIAVAAFYLLSNQVAFSQAVAGFYNGLGDLYKVRSQHLLSEQYYKQGSMYGYMNHKSNYQLGFIANSKEKPGEALYYFDQASGKHPSPHSFVNLSNQYQMTRQFFKGIFTLQKASSRFLSNGYIGNNLGVLYSSTSILDSALFYLRSGTDTGFSGRAAKANIAYLAYKTGTPIAGNEMTDMIDERNAYAFLTNAIASRLQADTAFLPEPVLALVPDSVLNGLSFPFVNNAAFATLGASGNILSERLPAITENPANAGYYGPLSVALALQHYFNGEVSVALQKLDYVQQTFPTLRPYCFYLMGTITLDQGAALESAELLEQAASENYPGAALNQAIALSEAGNEEQAQLKWIFLENSEEEAPLAASILPLFESGAADELKTDQDRYQYVRWFGDRLSREERERAWESFENENMQKAAMVSLADRFFRLGKVEEAKEVLSLPQLNEWSQPELHLLRISMALRENGIEVLEEERNLSSLPPTSIKVFHAAAEALKNGDLRALKDAGGINPFRQELMIAIANHLASNEMDEAAYEVLVLAQQANSYSIPVLKTYIDLSLQMGFENYAESALIRLQSLLSPEEYALYERAFDQKLEEIERKREEWSF